MTAPQLAQQLRSVAGVSPSWHFLEDCCAASGTNATVDYVLQQILYHDLRSVVRVLERGSNLDNVENNSALPSVQLRRAISESISTTCNCKAVLPESFKLMVQIEELLDKSLGVEARHSSGTGTNYHNAPATGNQTSSRCLKLLLSDGYYGNGLPMEAPIDVDQENMDHSIRSVIVAMETSLIPQLSATSPAGIKALLKGPVVIRHGMLQLCAANLVVLGGSVAHLVELQKQAIQQARRLAGVDPTIRALIGPEGLLETQEDDDVGEGESGDVHVPLQGQHYVASRVPNRPSQQALSAATTVQNQSTTLMPPNATTPQTTNRVNDSNSHPSTTANNRYDAAGNSDNRCFGPSVTLPVSNNNPYGSTARRPSARTDIRQDGGVNALTPPEGTASIVRLGSSAVAPNPYARSGERHGQTSSLSPLPNTQTVSPAFSTHTNSTSALSTATSAASTPHGFVGSSTRLSFGELQTLLQRLRSDEMLYRQHVGKRFTTLLQQDGVKLYFNIEKKKKDALRREQGKDDKYIYVMSARFKSPGSDGLVTCKIASSILEPSFGVKPGDMRKMNKEDKQRANELVKEGGRKVQVVLNAAHDYEWTLAMSTEEFFARSPPIDGTEPVLLLLSLQT